MKTLCFLCSLLLFLLYIHNDHKRRGEERKGGKCAAIRASALNDVKRAQEERERELNDYNFYVRRLEELETALQSAREEEEKKQERVSGINMYNQYGAVISEKQVSKSKRELHTIQQRRFTIENQIRNAVKGKQKAIDKLTGER